MGNKGQVGAEYSDRFERFGKKEKYVIHEIVMYFFFMRLIVSHCKKLKEMFTIYMKHLIH